jgi:hypothetical protein
VKRSGMPPRASYAAGTAQLRAAYPRYAQWHDTEPDEATRQLVLARDNYACVCCGKSIIGQPYNIHHVKLRSQGGTHTAKNLITLLGTGTMACHGRIHSHIDPRDKYRGYIAESWEDPAAKEMWLVTGFGSRWVLRLPDGTYEDADPPEATS